MLLFYKEKYNKCNSINKNTTNITTFVFPFMFSISNIHAHTHTHKTFLNIHHCYFLFQRKMHAFLLLGCFVFAVSEYFLGSAHMIPDERLATNRVVVSGALSQSLEVAPPSVVIVGRCEPLMSLFSLDL